MSYFDDEEFRVLPVLRFDEDNVSDGSSQIDDADANVETDNSLMERNPE